MTDFPSSTARQPLNMRRLRAGTTLDTDAELTTGTVVNVTALLRRVEAAIAAARADSSLIMMWTIGLRPLPAARWGRTELPPQPQMAKAVAERLTSLDTGLVFVSGPVDLINGFAFGLRRRNDAERVADDLLRILGLPFEIDSHLVHFEARIGSAVLDDDNPDGSTALEASRLALAATDESKPSRTFSRRLRRAWLRQEELRHDLEAAVGARALDILYQPIVDLDDEKLVGVEVVVRWEHTTRGTLEPIDFLPLVECTPLIYDLGDLVLSRSYETVSGWADRELNEAITMWVDVTPAELLRADFAERVRSALDPSSSVSLGFVMGQGAALAEKAVSDVVRALATDDVRAAVDDFGGPHTMGSVVNGLVPGPFDTVRLSRDLVARVESDAESRLAVRLGTELATGRGLTVMAAGVESQQQLDVLHELGVRAVQGSHVGGPMAADELADRLPGDDWRPGG